MAERAGSGVHGSVCLLNSVQLGFVCFSPRAAARCNKGIEVLLAVALEHFVLVVVRVLRGPTPADDSARKVRYLIHCQWCEERVFQKEGNMMEGKWFFFCTLSLCSVPCFYLHAFSSNSPVCNSEWYV